jgi:hypothetical protein
MLVGEEQNSKKGTNTKQVRKNQEGTLIRNKACKCNEE